uniref:Myosin motor domain-containing protein n=1 Tax=Cyanoptyche gloeocystis TaxID=77922 RepID=A0A7S2JLY7_9EUKA
MTRKMQTPGSNVIIIPLRLHEAVASRNALAKAVYQRLFDYVVKRVNDSLLTVTTPHAYIGVLDIFGFEVFQRNSFEQFCINFTNEKLQHYFNQQIFKQEEELYLKEGIKWQPVTYEDNSDTLDMIEKRPGGILSILDEQNKLPKCTDKTFTMKVHETFKAHKKLKEPRTIKGSGVSKEEGFVVKHFAGDVLYNSSGFLDKNNDSLHPDLLDLLRASDDAFLNTTLFPTDKQSKGPAPAKAAQRFSTVATKFSTQLGELMRDIGATSSHFIRCLKPNTEQRPNIFQGGMVLNQIIASGMHEALRLLHSGFPTRCPFDALYDRYRSQMPPALANLKPSDFCGGLLEALDFSKKDFQLGLTKVFFKAGKLAFLDEITGGASNMASDMVEKVKRWLCKKRLRRAQFATVAAVKVRSRLHMIRLLYRLRKTVRVVVVINKTMLRAARKARSDRASRLLQAVMRMWHARQLFVKLRSSACAIQSVFRFHSVYGRHKDELRRRINEAKRKVQEDKVANKKHQQDALVAEANRRLEEKRLREEAVRQRQLETAQARAADRATRDVAPPAAAVVQAVVPPNSVVISSQEWDELKKYMVQLTDRVATLENQLALKEDRAVIADKLAGVESKVEELAGKVKDSEELDRVELDRLNAKLEEENGNVLRISESFHEMSTAVSRFEGTLERVQETHVEKLKQLDVLADRVSAQQEDGAKKQQEHEDRIDALWRHLEEHSKRTDMLDASLREFKASVDDTLRAVAVGEMRQVLGRLEAGVQVLERREDKMEARVHSVEERTKTLEVMASMQQQREPEVRRDRSEPQAMDAGATALLLLNYVDKAHFGAVEDALRAEMQRLSSQSTDLKAALDSLGKKATTAAHLETDLLMDDFNKRADDFDRKLFQFDKRLFDAEKEINKLDSVVRKTGPASPSPVGRSTSRGTPAISVFSADEGSLGQRAEPYTAMTLNPTAIPRRSASPSPNQSPTRSRNTSSSSSMFGSIFGSKR